MIELIKKWIQKKNYQYLHQYFSSFENQKDQLKQNNRQDKEASWLFNTTVKKNGNLLNLQAMYGRYCGLRKPFKK